VAVKVSHISRFLGRSLFRRDALCRGSHGEYSDDRELRLNSRVLRADLAWDTLESLAPHCLPSLAGRADRE
jgi:hypothetical protein